MIIVWDNGKGASEHEIEFIDTEDFEPVVVEKIIGAVEGTFSKPRILAVSQGFEWRNGKATNFSDWLSPYHLLRRINVLNPKASYVDSDLYVLHGDRFCKTDLWQHLPDVVFRRLLDHYWRAEDADIIEVLELAAQGKSNNKPLTYNVEPRNLEEIEPHLIRIRYPFRSIRPGDTVIVLEDTVVVLDVKDKVKREFVVGQIKHPGGGIQTLVQR